MKTQSGWLTAVRGTAKHKEAGMKGTVKTTVAVTLALLLSAGMLAGCDLGETVNVPASPPTETENNVPTDKPEQKEDKNDVLITFDLPEQWRPAEQSGGGDLYWSTYIPSEIVYATPPEVMPDEREQQHYWSFYLEASKTLKELGKEEGDTIKEVAESYYKNRIRACEEVYICEENHCEDGRSCDVLPFVEETYSGVTVYSVKHIDKSGNPMFLGEYAEFFLEKDGYFFTFGIRGYLDDPITQQTVEQVVKSLIITEKKGSDS